MAHPTKIATCCYCGTRAALVLGKDRHELTCAACGAPLHELKGLRSAATAQHPIETNPTPKKRTRGVTPLPIWERERSKSDKKKKKKKSKKSLSRRVFSEAFDVLEDLFD